MISYDRTVSRKIVLKYSTTLYVRFRVYKTTKKKCIASYTFGATAMCLPFSSRTYFVYDSDALYNRYVHRVGFPVKVKDTADRHLEKDERFSLALKSTKTQISPYVRMTLLEAFQNCENVSACDCVA